jgi:hypothetical protein
MLIEWIRPRPEIGPLEQELSSRGQEQEAVCHQKYLVKRFWEER